MGHNILGNRIVPVMAPYRSGSLQNGQFLAGFFTVLLPGRNQGATIVQFGQQHSDFLFFIQLVILDRLAVMLDRCTLIQFGQNALVYVRALPQIKRSQVKSKHGHRLLQLLQTQGHHAPAWLSQSDRAMTARSAANAAGSS